MVVPNWVGQNCSICLNPMPAAIPAPIPGVRQILECNQCRQGFCYGCARNWVQARVNAAGGVAAAVVTCPLCVADWRAVHVTYY